MPVLTVQTVTDGRQLQHTHTQTDRKSDITTARQARRQTDIHKDRQTLSGFFCCFFLTLFSCEFKFSNLRYGNSHIPEHTDKKTGRHKDSQTGIRKGSRFHVFNTVLHVNEDNIMSYMK
jgi:hypothetical protein